MCRENVPFFYSRLMLLVRVHILNKDVQTVDKYTISICKNKNERPRKSFVFVSTLLGGGCLMTDLFRCCHEINGCVVLIILLKQTEGELVVYQKMIYKKKLILLTAESTMPNFIIAEK